MAAPILTENEINAKFNLSEVRAQEWEFPELDGLYSEHEDKISPPVKEDEPEQNTESSKEESTGVMGQEDIDKLVSTVKKDSEEPTANANNNQTKDSPTPESTAPPAPKATEKEPDNAIMDPDDIAALVANLSSQATEPEPKKKPVPEPEPETKPEPQTPPQPPESPIPEPPPAKPQPEPAIESDNSMMGQDEIEALLNSMNPRNKSEEKAPEPPQEEEEEEEIDLNPSPEELEALLGGGLSDTTDNIDESDILAADDIAASFTQKEIPLDIPQTTEEAPSSQTEKELQPEITELPEVTKSAPKVVAPIRDNNISGLESDEELQNIITAKLEKAEQLAPENKTEELEQSLERLLVRTAKIQNTISDTDEPEEEPATQFDEKAFAELVRPIQQKTPVHTTQVPEKAPEPPKSPAKRPIPLPDLKKSLLLLGVAALILLAFIPEKFNPFKGLFQTIAEVETITEQDWQKNPNPDSEVRARFKAEWKKQTVRGALSYLEGFRIVKDNPNTANNELSPALIRNAIENYYSTIEGPKNKLGRPTWITDSGQIGENEPHFYVNYFTPSPDNGHHIRKSLFLQHENGILKLDLISKPAREEDVLKASSTAWQALDGVMKAKLSGSISTYQENEQRKLIISDPLIFAQNMQELHKQSR